MKSFTARSKILIIKCLVYLVLTIGKIYVRVVLLLRGSDKLDVKKCSVVVFNRSDRIWDAVVSLPFFRAWIDFARNRLGFEWRVIIIASEWNEFVLRELVDTHAVEILVQRNPDDYVVSISSLMGRSLKNFSQLIRSRFSIKPSMPEHIGFDMVGDAGFICDFRRDFFWKVFGWCIFPIVVGFDYPTIYPYVSHANTTLLQTYAKICSDVLVWFQEFPKYLADYIESTLPEKKVVKTDRILLFVGTKSHRNLLNAQWCKVIVALSNWFPDKNFTILDDRSELVSASLSWEELPNNVILRKNDFLLGSQVLSDFLSGFDAIVWVDWGGMNFIRQTAISATIYTTAQSETWRPFLWNERMESKQQEGWELIMIFPSDSKKQFSAFLRKKSMFVPTYEIPERGLFEDFPPELLVEFVKKVYEN